MLPIQMVAAACLGVVYSWFITQPYLVHKVDATRQLILENAKRIRDEARALLDSVSRFRSRHHDPWRPAPSPQATLTRPLPVHSLDIVPSLPSLPPLPLFDYASSLQSLLVPSTAFPAPSPPVVSHPRCFTFETNFTQPPQCSVVGRPSPYTFSASSISCLPDALVEYSPLVGVSGTLCTVVLSSLAAICLIVTWWVRRIERYSRETQLGDYEVLDVEAESAHCPQQVSTLVSVHLPDLIKRFTDRIDCSDPGGHIHLLSVRIVPASPLCAYNSCSNIAILGRVGGCRDQDGRRSSSRAGENFRLTRSVPA